MNINKEDTGSNVDPTLFKRLVGSVMYLTATRLGIMFVVSMISKFMETPKEMHSHVGIRISRYIAGTKSYVILYSRTANNSLIVYTDNDFARSICDRKSTSGFSFHLG